MWYIYFETHLLSHLRTGRTELRYSTSCGRGMISSFQSFESIPYKEYVRMEKQRKANELFIALRCHEGRKAMGRPS